MPVWQQTDLDYHKHWYSSPNSLKPSETTQKSLEDKLQNNHTRLAEQQEHKNQNLGLKINQQAIVHLQEIPI